MAKRSDLRLPVRVVPVSVSFLSDCIVVEGAAIPEHVSLDDPKYGSSLTVVLKDSELLRSEAKRALVETVKEQING